MLKRLNLADRLGVIADGERNSADFAELLGLADWPKAEQRKEVNRVKQRLVKRLR